jgi:hypothetical protein
MKRHKAFPIELQRLSQHDWEERINSIPSIQSSEKPKVASIVWFDFFQNRRVKHHGVLPSNFPLEAMVKQWNRDMEIESERLAWILTNLGYSSATANSRSQKLIEKSQTIKQDGDILYDGIHSGHGVGAKACFLAVCQQAVLDILTLVKMKVIIEGKINPEWPNNSKFGTIGYKSKKEVQDLIDWISNGDMKNLIETLDLRIDISSFLEAIGFCSPVSYAIKVEQTKKYNQVNLRTQIKQEKSFVEFEDSKETIIHY